MKWTIETAAQKLRVSERTIRRWCKAGVLEYEIRRESYRDGHGRFYIVPVVHEHLLTTRALAESMDYSVRYTQRLVHRTQVGQKIGGVLRIPLTQAANLMLMRLGTGE